MVGLKTPFGDEESDLLDQFERMWYESHLKMAMQNRSLSVSSSFQQESTTQGKKRRGFRPVLHRVLKKFINPILGVNSKRSDGSIQQVHDLKQHPLTFKVHSRSLHF